MGNLLHCLWVLLTIIFYVSESSANGLCDSCDAACAAATTELPHAKRCRCDEDCTAYGDCCGDAFQCSNGPSPKLLDGLDCRRTGNIFLDAYRLKSIGLSEYHWMVSACPNEWLASSDPQRTEIASNCIDDKSRLPPVSDYSNGIVYKNEYCAVCNSVENAVRWGYGLGCTMWLYTELLLASEGYVIFELTLDIIERECIICGYEPPQVSDLASQARACYPHVASCLDADAVAMPIDEYELAVTQCGTEPFNPVWAWLGDTIYRNEYCAMCNNVSTTNCSSLPGELFHPPPPFIPFDDSSICLVEAERRLGNQLRPPSVYNTTLVPPNETIVDNLPFIRGTPFTVVLNVGSNGVQVSTSIVGTIAIIVECEENEVYDPEIEGCRPMICPGLFENGTSNGCHSNTSCRLIELMEDDDYQLLNSSTLIYSGIEYDIVQYIEGNPVICTDFNMTGTIERNVTIIFYSYPAAYFYLTYIGCSLSLLGVIVILISLVLFKELRTLTTIILANLSVCLIVTDILILVGGPVANALESRSLCEVVSIVNHYFYLAQFTWMTIMTIEITRTLLRGVRMRMFPSKRAVHRTFIIYFITGWTIPLFIVIPTIIINYSPSTSHLVLYGHMEDGTDGVCWINHELSLIIAFIVPMSISLIINLIGLVIVSVILIQAIGNQLNIHHSATYTYVRVYCAVFFSSGATWVFGFIALLVDQDWAWYLFIIFNSVQGFVLFLSFMFTKKVGALYLLLFTCGRVDYRVATSSSKNGKSSTTDITSDRKKSLEIKHNKSVMDNDSKGIKSPDSEIKDDHIL